ncbi:peptidoglycan-binding protein [Aquicoccus sp. SCR17]|nr:peptidoglycan-binding protein [Carideicomes alvinocaridis]
MTRALSTLVFTILLTLTALATGARAQEQVWIQIEAHPSLSTAENRARNFARGLDDVNGFTLGSGWYGIALGPYTEQAAQQVMTRLRAQGRIPRDSYLTRSDSYRRQFYPVGASALSAPAQAEPASPETANEPAAETESAEVTQPEADTAQTETPEPQPEPVDESPAEARRSEARLSGEERMQLQVALRWAGFYDAAIDGAFGRGTRGSMAQWQEANGYEPTGILTTRQRAELIGQYNAVLDGLDMRRVADREAGIEMVLPMGVVALEKYEYPFAHYSSTDPQLGARVLLISQAGNRDTLHGLYDIMQTLEIVPREGPRDRDADGFTLEGRNDEIVSFTRATLSGGEIKGFTLVWPAGDEERRSRVLREMRSSFSRLPGVLDPASGANAEQDIDLVSGLEIRKPKLSRSGFYVNDGGAVVTTLEAVESCGRITIDHDYEARLVASDAESGVAVLRPATQLAPMSVAAFRSDMPRLKSEVAVSGYSFEGVLPGPTMTYGSLADLRGLGGEDRVKRLALAHQPGDAGGPVLDTGGSVLGMLLPRREGDRELPDEVSFATDASAIRAVLDGAGLSAQARQATRSVDPAELSKIAAGMTVLVSCWE